MQVLRMLEDGAISAEEAATLLEALDRANPQQSLPSAAAAPRGVESRLVRIRVTDSEDGRVTINLAFPLGLLKSGLDIAGQFVPEYLPKVEAIRESMATGFRGPLVDIDDGSQRVEIIAE